MIKSLFLSISGEQADYTHVYLHEIFDMFYQQQRCQGFPMKNITDI